MKYEIVCNGKVIAQFMDKSDAEMCLDPLEEMYDDCVFEIRSIQGG